MFKSLSAFILLFLALAATCHASPYKAILYPRGATLFEQQQLAAGTSRVILNLPQVANPESLRTYLGPEAEATRITSIESRSVLPEQPNFIPLRAKIDELKTQLTQAADRIQAGELALSYWQKQEAVPTANNLTEAKALSELIRSESQALLLDISQIKAEQTQLQQQLDEAERQLREQTGNAKRIWQVELQLSSALPQATQLYFDYRINKAGWQSTYRLNAIPQDGQVEWSWHAEITQTSGSDWKDVALQVATSEPVFTLTPPNNSPWIIREQQAARYSSNAKMVRTQLMVDAVEAEAPAAAPAEPVRTEGQLFDSYDLGRLSIASGSPARVQIREGRWPAAFSYLARPLQSPQAFLTAKLSFAEEFLPMPSGTASIQVDGVHVGRRAFALHEKQDVAISFGSDPGIAIEVESAPVAGNKGLIAKKDTYNWNWTLRLTNNKSIPVDLRVEDSYPHLAHEEISIEELFSPPLPDKGEEGLLSWQLELAPGAQQVLSYGYSVSHPEDMEVLLGR
jgi:uncharacterized protein (TIGR02231 family)